MNQAIWDSISRLDAWVVEHDYQGFEPFDGLSSWLRPLAYDKFGRQALQQAVKRLPLNIRPLLGVRPATSTKAMGYFARAYLKLYRATRDASYLNRAESCLTWLVSHPSKGYSGLCWGNHFDYQSRVFYLPKGAPTAVWTAHIGHAFLDAYELIQDSQYLEAMQSICRFFIEDLERRREKTGVCISYIPGRYCPVHNSNMLAAAVLARTYAITNDILLRDIASCAVTYTVDCQRQDGSWWYGEADTLRWTDSWHTAYVLDSLWWYMKSTGDLTHRAAFERGAEFWRQHFFLHEGTPKFYAHETYPIDIQAASQSIETLSLLSKTYDSDCMSLSNKVACWTIANMQDRDGHFYYQRTRRWSNRTPMLHWGQATMLYALASLLLEECVED